MSIAVIMRVVHKQAPANQASVQPGLRQGEKAEKRLSAVGVLTVLVKVS